MKDRGTQEERTIPYSSQQNGVAERMNRTLMDKVRSMLYHSNLPQRFWGEALSTAVYVANRSPTSAITETPYERWNEGLKPDVSNLRVFGCDAYMHVPDEKRKKLDRKSLKCVFVGYPVGKKGYKLFHPGSGKWYDSRDVMFFENVFKHNVEKCDEPEELLPAMFFQDDDHIDENDADDDGDNHDGSDEDDGDRDDDDEDDEDNADINENVENDEVYSRPRRGNNAPDFYGKVVSHRFGKWEEANIAVTDDPKSFRDAMKGSNSQKWKPAIEAEMNSLRKNNTWELVDLPHGKSAIGSKWVFKTKLNADGTINKHKARLVAQGFKQKQGIDYDEVFAPVVKYTSIRTLLSIANDFDMEVHQMDVNSAYLNGDIDADIYMVQPEGYVDPNHPNKVCKLLKSLYGLKQSARCWNKKIDNYLKSEGYTPSSADPCIYVRSKEGKIVILALYVDDNVIMSNSKKLLEAEKTKLSQRFDMEDRGEINYLLGMSVKRDRQKQTLKIDQKLYIQQVLERFGMQDCKPVSTPIESGRKFQKTQEDETAVDTKRYQELIGSLVYASVSTRPDISEAVGKLSQHMSRPNNEHWVGAKRVLRYLKGTAGFGLVYTKSDHSQLRGYSDSDWAGCTDTRRSTSGYLFMIGNNVISWASKKQPVVALSTTEAEYIALCSATQEAVWLRRLLESIQHVQNGPTTIVEDNQGTISMAKNLRDSSRTKHIDIRYHFNREAVEKNITKIEYCETGDMVADTFTKPLPKPAFEKHRASMNIRPC